MPSFSEFHFKSSTDVNDIYCRVCTPDTEPRAVIQIAHGVADHISRYDHMAMFFAERGFVVAGNDHLGHGHNIKSPVDEGFFATNNGWNHVVEDMDRLRNILKEQYPYIPHILLGHSMGSFLVRTYIIKHPGKYDAAVLSGTGHQPRAMVLAGYATAAAAVKLNGALAEGRILNDIAFGSYNSRIENCRTSFDWISSVPEEVDKYIADPWCGFVGKMALYRDMMYGIKFITDTKNLAKMSKDQPIYIYSGDADPVGEYGKGVERFYRALCKAGCRDVFLKLYPNGRHEMHNEYNKEQVFEDLFNWLKQKFPV